MKKYLVILIIIAFNISIGFFIADDYGESWDEANMRSYASMSIKAYENIIHPEKMQNFYNVEDDRRYYGPVYMMVCKIIVDFFSATSGLDPNSIYHFLTFLIFQVGLFFFYSINKRFFPIPVALANTLIFNFQPLFWGHAFINPKDIPIMVFFLGAFDSGLNLVNTIQKNEVENNSQSNFRKIWRSAKPNFMNSIKTIKNPIYFAIIIYAFVIFVYTLKIHTALISSMVSFAANNPESFPGFIFNKIAENRISIPLGSYIEKATTLVNSFSLLVIFVFTANPIIQIFKNAYAAQIQLSLSLMRQSISKTIKTSISLFISPMFWGELLKYFIKSILEISRCWQFWAAAFMLGLVSSTRLNGPYAGVLISLFLIIRNPKKAFPIIFFYAIISFLTMYLLWPFLWGDPFGRYFEAVAYMSNFPWSQTVLFDGIRYRITNLPAIYLPRLLFAQFTETSILVIMAGAIISVFGQIRKRKVSEFIFLITLWSLFPILAVIFLHIPIYDNFRHIFFLIPPLFFLGSEALNTIYVKTKFPLFIAIIILIVTPGFYSIIKLHPYEYVYYNMTLGGLEGVKDKYELDYFGTSIKEATEFVNGIAPYGSSLYVYAPGQLVKAYARPDLELTKDFEKHINVKNAFTINLNRFYWGNKIFPDDIDIYEVMKEEAIFASVRKVK